MKYDSRNKQGMLKTFPVNYFSSCHGINNSCTSHFISSFLEIRCYLAIPFEINTSNSCIKNIPEFDLYILMSNVCILARKMFSSQDGPYNNLKEVAD